MICANGELGRLVYIGNGGSYEFTNKWESPRNTNGMMFMIVGTTARIFPRGYFDGQCSYLSAGQLVNGYNFGFKKFFPFIDLDKLVCGWL